MKEVKHEIGRLAMQGDIAILPIDEPKDIGEELKINDEHFVAAHSESGHHHVMDKNNIKVFLTDSNFKTYVFVIKPTELTHVKNSVDKHETHLLQSGWYQFPSHDLLRSFNPLLLTYFNLAPI